jgi:beta-glucanase (GH16 family)
MVQAAQCPTLVWHDEFNGTALDLNKWEPQIGDGCDYGVCQWGNNELEYYKADNAVVSNGALKILVKQERVKRYNYTSARLRTSGLGDFTYGRFEARMKLLKGQGLWPAFWMLSSNEPKGGWPQSGEIDIMESLVTVVPTVVENRPVTRIAHPVLILSL